MRFLKPLLEARRVTPLAGTVILVTLLSTSLLADTIVLKSGKKMEGVIVSETSSSVVIDIGMGQITLSRGKIARIIRADQEAQGELLTEWKQKYFLNDENVPTDLKSLANGFKTLQAQRDSAAAERDWHASVPALRAAIKEKVARLRSDLIENEARLLRAATDGKSSAYNALVATNNSLIAAINAKRKELHKTGDVGTRRVLTEELDTLLATFDLVSAELDSTDPTETSSEYQEAVDRNTALLKSINDMGNEFDAIDTRDHSSRKAIATYLQALDDYTGTFADARRAYDTGQNRDEQRDYFFETIQTRLDAFVEESASGPVETAQLDGVRTVIARINGLHEVRFVIDTGASCVTLSRSTAKRMGLGNAAGETVNLVLADGRRIEGTEIVLGSVQVGNATASNVEAVILPEGRASMQDNLLGMSFLGNFQMTFDSDGQLVLRDFAPK